MPDSHLGVDSVPVGSRRLFLSQRSNPDAFR